MTASQTAPTTNDTATIIDEHRIIGTATGTTGIAIECNCGHRSMTSTNDYLDAPISSDWNPRRDAEHLHAEHVAKNLAAQQGPALLAALTPRGPRALGEHGTRPREAQRPRLFLRPLRIPPRRREGRLMTTPMRFTDGATIFEGIELTRDTLEEITGWAMLHGYVVGGALGGAHAPGPVHLTINEVRIDEGQVVFQRASDGRFGQMSREKFAELVRVEGSPAEQLTAARDLAVDPTTRTQGSVATIRTALEAAEGAHSESDGWLWADEALTQIEQGDNAQALWEKVAGNLAALIQEQR